MPSTNPFFTSTTGYTGEQNLVDSLVIEQIGMFGIDLMYMPRENLNLDKLLHESTQDAFKFAMSIPMYIKSFDGYDNGIEMLSKFGVRSSDEITLIMSRSQWTAYYAPYVKSFYNEQSGRDVAARNNPLDGQISSRPKEGDLIFFPYDNGIFEIKYVMFDQPFFQLGKGYIFELQCEKFEYSGEDFSTGISEVDTLSQRADFYTLEFNFQDGGTDSYEFQEKVKIYDLTTIDPEVIGEFKIYDDPGFLRNVDVVEGSVSKWDQPKKQLQVTDLTDLNPNQENTTTHNATVNTFDVSLVVGQTSGARWISTAASTTPRAFDDADELQKEFDEIKIYDPFDDSPFGFY